MRRRVLLAGASLGALGALAVLGTRAPERGAASAAGDPERASPGAPLSATARSFLPLARRSDGSGHASAPDRRDGEGSALDRLFRSYSAAELSGLARFERLTGRAAPRALLQLVERRRAGADEAELVAEATRAFAGDPLGRAAALESLRATGGR